VITSLAISPNGRILASGCEQMIKLWDIAEIIRPPEELVRESEKITGVASAVSRSD